MCRSCWGINPIFHLGRPIGVPPDEFGKNPLRIVASPTNYEALTGESMLLTDIEIAFTEIKNMLSPPKN